MRYTLRHFFRQTREALRGRMAESPRYLNRSGLPDHTLWVKVSHWTITVSFLTLAFTGVLILMVHPRLYWGEVGNDLTRPLIELPISRNYHHGGWEGTAAFFKVRLRPSQRIVHTKYSIRMAGAAVCTFWRDGLS